MLETFRSPADTPAFTVGLSLVNTEFAQLRTNDVGSVSEVRTSTGVASWSNLGLLGWPGRYLLRVRAVPGSSSDSSPRNPDLPEVSETLDIRRIKLAGEVDAKLKKEKYTAVVWAAFVAHVIHLGLVTRDRRLPPRPSSNRTVE
jgi:hypothetical protein